MPTNPQPRRHSPYSLRALFVGLGFALAGLAAGAQSADPPARIARIEVAEGSVQFQPASENQAQPADPRWPLGTGDRLWTGPGARAELHAGSATARLGAGSELALTTLDDRTTQLRLTSGTLGVTVRDLQSDERFEIDTPNLAVLVNRPGRWRVDVDPTRGTTRVSAEQGGCTLYGEDGRPLDFVAPQRRDFSGRQLAGSPPLSMQVADAFDRWSADRDRQIAQSPSLRYTSADMPGITQLDSYGDWGNDPRYGAIWYPRSVATDWAPYRDGRWEWIDPWGWTWIDALPWGFAPSHYGRWAQVGSRWGWVPGPLQPRPAYAPAVVGFVGGGLPAGGGRPGVGWFPLAPGERWKPPFNASPGYVARLNRAGFAQDNTNGYYYQTRPGAVTMVPTDDFGRRGMGGARPRVPGPDELAQGRPGRPPEGPGRWQAGASQQFQAAAPLMQPLPQSAPLYDRARQDQWERGQRDLQNQQQAQIQRQEQLRQQQERFQPGFNQRQWEMQQQGQQQMQMQQQFQREQIGQQQREQFQQQQRFQQDQMRQQQAQQQQAQQQQMQAQQQQQRQQQMQMEQQQRQQAQQMQQQQEVQRQQQQAQQQQMQQMQQQAREQHNQMLQQRANPEGNPQPQQFRRFPVQPH